jgi:hypothetical protein
MNLEKNFDLKGFGDSLVNFLYSLAKSWAIGTWTGEKVSNYVLAQALIASTVRDPGGLDKHEKGDYVEGYIAHSWITKAITIEEAAKVLAGTLQMYDLEEEEQDAMVDAFCSLLNYIKNK